MSHVVVQPVLVWDDGEDLSPGPEVQPLSLPQSHLAAFGTVYLPQQVKDLAEKLAAEEDDSPS